MAEPVSPVPRSRKPSLDWRRSRSCPSTTPKGRGVARSLMPAGSGREWPRRSSGVAAVGPHQLPRSRSHIVSQDVGLTRGRGDAEVPVVRPAPLVNDRKDLDELVLTGEATRRPVYMLANSWDGRPCAVAVASATRCQYALSRGFSGPGGMDRRPVSINAEGCRGRTRSRRGCHVDSPARSRGRPDPRPAAYDTTA